MEKGNLVMIPVSPSGTITKFPSHSFVSIHKAYEPDYLCLVILSLILGPII
ncbi:hypothetical protein LBYZC6_45450 [Lacrimispora brassicae]